MLSSIPARRCFLLVLIGSLRQAVDLVLTLTVDAVYIVRAARAGAVLALLGTIGSVVRLSSPLLSKVYIGQHVRTVAYRGTLRLSGSGPTGPILLRTGISVDTVGSVLLAGHIECSLETRPVKVCVYG